MNKALRERALHEFKAYWINVLYLSSMFGVLTWYRRLLLMQHGISYEHYGIAIINALIMAKLILIGDALHLGHGFERKPLIYPTLYRTVVFTCFVAFFTFFEDTITGFFHGKGWLGGVDEFKRWGPYGFLAKMLVLFVTFIPFYAFRELSRVLGGGRVARLFFHNPSPTDSELPGGATQPAT